MSDIKDKEKLQSLGDEEVEQVSGGADKEKKYKGPIPGLDHPVAMEYGGPRPTILKKYGGPPPKHDRPIAMDYGMPTPKYIDPKLFLEHKKDEDSGEE